MQLAISTKASYEICEYAQLLVLINVLGLPLHFDRVLTLKAIVSVMDCLFYCLAIQYGRTVMVTYSAKCDTDIQLKTLSRRVEVFDMKIIMRRDFMIF